MKSNFNDCLTRLLKDEGGYSNTAGDNGGPTNYGITLADYRSYINRSAVAADVKGMSVNDAKAIYKSKYWDALNCDTLSSGVDYTVFDYGVNSGLGRPRKALQRFKGQTGSDLIDAINNERTTFLKGLAASQAHDKQFLNGWLARVSRVRNYSHYLNANAPKSVAAGPAAATGVGGFFYGLSQFWHNHETLLIIGGIATAIVVGAAVHLFLNKGK